MNLRVNAKFQWRPAARYTHKACGRAAWRPNRAQVGLNLVSITLLKKLKCQISRNETTSNRCIRSRFTDGYDRLQQRKLPSIPSHEWKLYHPYEFRPWPTSRYTGYGNGWSEEYGFSSEVEKWGIGSLLDVFLFLSSLLLLFRSRPGTNGIGMDFYHLRSQSSGGGVSPCVGSSERSPLGCTDRLPDLWVCPIAYVGWLFHSCFPFLLFSYTGFGSPGGLGLKRGIL